MTMSSVNKVNRLLILRFLPYKLCCLKSLREKRYYCQICIEFTGVSSSFIITFYHTGKINHKGVYHCDYPKSLVKLVYYNHTHTMWYKSQKIKSECISALQQHMQATISQR